MEVIPAVDMKDGECVQLVQGDEETAKGYGDPVDAARRWTDEGAERLHVIDLDGAIEGERRNARHVRRIVEETRVAVQVGGGVRTVEDATTLFEAGADRVVMGTAAMENPPSSERSPNTATSSSLSTRAKARSSSKAGRRAQVFRPSRRRGVSRTRARQRFCSRTSTTRVSWMA